MGSVYVGVDERLERQVAVKAIRPERRLDQRRPRPVPARGPDAVAARAPEHLPALRVRRKRRRATSWCSSWSRARTSRAIARERSCRDAQLAHRRRQVADGPRRRPRAQRRPPRPQAGQRHGHRRRDGQGARLRPRAHRRGRQPGASRPSRARQRAGRLPAATASGPLRSSARSLGTPRYMSPEQARGEPVTAASDMYSFGLLLQELFTGTPPLPPDLPREVLLQRAMWGETEPSAGIEPRLRTLVDALKSLKPGDRPGRGGGAGRLRWIADTPRRRLRRLTAAAVAAIVVAAPPSCRRWASSGARRAQARAEASEASGAQGAGAGRGGQLLSHDDAVERRSPRGWGTTSRSPTCSTRRPPPWASPRRRRRHPRRRARHARRHLPRPRRPAEGSAVARAGARVPPRQRGAGRPRDARDQAPARRPACRPHPLGRGRADPRRDGRARGARVLGDAHPDTLETMVQLALALRARPQVRGGGGAARRGARRAAAGRSGERDPATLRAQHALARVHFDLDRFAEAEALLRDCLATSRDRSRA